MAQIEVIKFPDGSFSCPLVFSLEDIVALREKHGIYGILSGTLPVNTQQNNFLYVPLRLTLDEAYFLVKNGLVNLYVRSNDANTNDDVLLANKSYKPTTENNFVPTPNVINKQNGNINDTLTEEWLLKNSESVKFSYPMYMKLRSQNITVLPGSRFGCKYVGYPGDPLRYHSQLIIHEPLDYHQDKLDLLNIISNTRLGTVVKKTHVISGCINADRKETDDSNPINDVKQFTIEWCGFG